jgi:Ser/Thr protein kinase RdoA (MazF antagonist)
MEDQAIVDEIKVALVREGIRHRRIVPIPALVPGKGRYSFRVELEGGGSIKARLLETGDTAVRLFELRGGLDEGFAPAIAAHGRVILEAWIEGQSLTDAEAWVEEAGSLLGRLHTRYPSETEAETRTWRERGIGALEDLAGSGTLDAEQVASLRATLRRCDPERERAVLVHLDFCGENMVIDGRGRLRVIDNEWMMFEPAGLDLARTFSRWPMSEGAAERFLRAYRGVAEIDLGSLPFWQIAVASFTARFRIATERDPSLPLALLRRFAQV